MELSNQSREGEGSFKEAMASLWNWICRMCHKGVVNHLVVKRFGKELFTVPVLLMVALIVFEQKTGLQDIIENGIGIDARITSGLLENIFEPNTPLHDGAVVIRGERVMSAASILTLTEASGISHDLGTRHRAAIGVSETTDAIVLIASEETGIISMAKGGKLTRHLDAKSLRTILEGIYVRKPHQRLLSMLVRRKGKEGAK